MPSVRDVWMLTVSLCVWLMLYLDENVGSSMAPECIAIPDCLSSHFHDDTRHCYYVINGNRLFEEAVNKCQADSYIVQLETQDEQTWLDSVYGPDVWLGMEGDGSTFYWITSRDPVSPDDPRWLTGTVGTRVAKQSDGKWAKTSPNNGHSVVCEANPISAADSSCSGEQINKDKREFTFSLSTSTNLKMFLSFDTKGPIACSLDCLRNTRCKGIQFTVAGTCRLLETSTDSLTCEGCYTRSGNC